MSPLLFRCDATTKIGTGHVMRCLALAQAWRRVGGEAIFAIAQCPEKLLGRLSNAGFKTKKVDAGAGTVADAEQIVRFAQETRAKWVVVDGDQFGSEFLARIKKSGIRLLLLDDFGERESFPADVIVNPNYGAKETPYRMAGYRGDLLVGSAYILLRSEFTDEAATGEQKDRRTGTRILVTLGGSDPDNMSPKVRQALEGLPGFEITLIAGAAYAHEQDLRASQRGNIRVLFDVVDMPRLMGGADMAIIVAGGTLWELLYMGCTVLTYSRNALQARVMAELASKGIVTYMGDIGQFSGSALVSKVQELADAQSARQEMAHAGRQLVDGTGAERVAEKLLSLLG